MCCFGSGDTGFQYGCIICFDSNQIDPLKYLSRDQKNFIHEQAAEELADAIATSTRCDIGRKKLCDIHQHLHAQWQRETGRNNEDWPGSFAEMSPERRKNVVDQNREWVATMKAAKGVDKKY
jgi:hypothetical protein